MGGRRYQAPRSHVSLRKEGVQIISDSFKIGSACLLQRTTLSLTGLYAPRMLQMYWEGRSSGRTCQLSNDALCRRRSLQISYRKLTLQQTSPPFWLLALHSARTFGKGNNSAEQAQCERACHASVTSKVKLPRGSFPNRHPHQRASPTRPPSSSRMCESDPDLQLTRQRSIEN
jgi:hypothetical protein